MEIRAYNLHFLLLLISGLTIVIEGKNVGTKAMGDTDTFIAAVYEHLPFLALPVCYEKGTLDKFLISNNFHNKSYAIIPCKILF